MKRRLLNVVTAVSLLLCVAVCVLWVRSGRRSGMIGDDRFRMEQHRAARAGGS